jgi:flagellar hook-associated protein 1
MLGLFGTLNLSARSMQVQQQGIEVAGHNMANVNNPAYARQRVAIETSTSITTAEGTQGTGADTSSISQIRNVLLDNHIVTETSVLGSLESQQQALQNAQSELGQQIDRSATGAEGTAAAAATGTQHGIGDSLSELFNAFQSLSTQPSSTTEREIVLTKASQLAARFQQTDKRLVALQETLNSAVEDEVGQVNGILDEIARLNAQIGNAESIGDGVANDLRDTRQAKLEELSKLIKFDAFAGNSGAVNISVSGVLLVDTNTVAERLEAYDDGSGKTFVRAATSDTPVEITSGQIHGLIETRDGAIQNLRDGLSSLASTLITEVNRIHQSGFGKDGSTGMNFFEGTDASTISVNQSLIDNPAKLHAADIADAAGNGANAIALARLANSAQASLGGQSFSQNYGRIVANLGESLSSVNEQITDQSVVSSMLLRQRDSFSAVSLDEEMTDLVKFQKAYQASAQLVNVVNEMLETVINMVN